VPACNTCFLRSTPIHNPNGSPIGAAVFAQLTAECRRTCPGVLFPLKAAPSHRDLDSPSNSASLGPPESITRTVSRSVQPFFALLTLECCQAYRGTSFPSKLSLPMQESGPPSNAWFFAPTRLSNLNGISIGSAVFSQLTADSPYTLQWAPLSPKIAPSHGVILASI